jgi:hypothetical protein
MIKLADEDLMKAAEALSFTQLSQQRVARGVERLPSSELQKVAHDVAMDGLSRKQTLVADRMGRALAHSKYAAKSGPVMTALSDIGSSLKKSLTFGRTRGLMRPTNVRVKRKTKKLEGMAALGERFRQQPGHVAKQVIKDVAPVAGTVYMGSRALSTNER